MFVDTRRLKYMFGKRANSNTKPVYAVVRRKIPLL